MNEALTNITTIISIVCIINTAIFAIQTIKESRQNKKAAPKDIKSQIDDYNYILEATQEIECNREKNTGQHFEDETIYLNRAKQIRVNSPFFSWVK